MQKPKVSVILPVYNGSRFIKWAITSILKQSYKNFELIIIDDCSTDNSLNLIGSFKDNRIRVFRNIKNLGVAKTLNIGLKKSKGVYIARCDSDDINAIDRFKKQVNYLDRNRECVLVGSQFEIIDDKGRKIGSSSLPGNNDEIIHQMLIRNPILHPSVMYRKSSVITVGGYRDFFNGAEDYDLWFRLSKLGSLVNLKDRLIQRRWHDNVVTRKYHFKVELMALLVRLINLKR